MLDGSHRLWNNANYHHVNNIFIFIFIYIRTYTLIILKSTTIYIYIEKCYIKYIYIYLIIFADNIRKSLEMKVRPNFDVPSHFINITHPLPTTLLITLQQQKRRRKQKNTKIQNKR